MDQTEKQSVLGENSPIEQNNTPEVKEKTIGEFKPKRKFLNFVSVANQRVRLISDIAFIKGEKLSGMGLDGVVFKVTICDEGINFEEVDTNRVDKAQRQRLIDDIDSMDVTGYTQKFVVCGIEFADKDARRCFLEVEYVKPIDKLMGIFDKPSTEISEKGMSFLDDLFGDDTNTTEVEVTESIEPVIEMKDEKPISHAQSMMEESFRKMNEDKVNELKQRVEDKETDIKKYKRDLTFAETKLKESAEQLGVLNTRLENMSPADEPNGYVFFITEEQKNDTGLDDTTKGIAEKIADLMGLKKDVLFTYLTEGFYKIKIGKKGENDKKLEFDKDILSKISSIDLVGKMTPTDTNEIEYRGTLNWHQLVSKMIRKGFEQDAEFNKLSGSNSYETKTEDDGGSYTGTKKCSHEDCGCSDDEKASEGEGMDKYKSEIERMAKGLGMKSVVFGEGGIELVPEEKDCDNCTNENCECGKNKEVKRGKVIKSVAEPQDIIIMGYSSDGDASFSITDDYSGFGLNVGKNEVASLECDGYGNIVSVPEFLSSVEAGKNDGEGFNFDATDAVLLQNFSGEIRVGVIDRNGKSDYDFDLSDYILHGSQFRDLNVSVFVDLPEGSDVVKLNENNLTSLLRDGKINTVLDKNMIKKFKDFDEERQEAYEEYEEFQGYPVGDDFLFAPGSRCDDQFGIVINPKSYWDNEKCCYDQHIDGFLIDTPEGFGEASESDFEYDGSLKEAIDKLANAGFKFNPKFQSFIDGSSDSYGDLTIDGLSITDYVVKTYPNIIV